MSRTVSLYYYLGIPAVVGGIMVIIMLLAALRYVRLYTADGRPLRWRDRAYWVRPLSAGAWSLNDSWATNITTMITLLATILGVTTASSALFPGVALDRFVIVNIVAGGIVAVAPLAFGVFYAGWTRHNPGIMADASLVLPQATAVKLASPAKVALARNTAVVLASGGERTFAPPPWRPWPGRWSSSCLAAGTSATLETGASALLADVSKAPAAIVVLPSGADVMLPGGGTVTAGGGDQRGPVTVKKGHTVHVPPKRGSASWPARS